MKKFLSLMLAFVFSLTLVSFVGCSTPKQGVGLKYYRDASQIVPLVMAGSESVALIPEPAVTNLETNLKKQGKTLYKLDLQELYDSQEKAYPQAVLMVKKSVINAHADLVEQLESAITASVSWAKENTATAVSTIKTNFGASTLNENTLTANAIDGCKIYWQGASQAKESVKNYINDIISIDTASASTITDDFFHTQGTSQNDKTEYTFACPDGAPAIAISKLIYQWDSLNTGKLINYNVVASNMIGAQMATGTADFVIMPVNAASKNYNKANASDPYVLVSVITHGNFYIVSTEDLSVKDLDGKTIAVPNKGAVPDWTIQLALKKHGLTTKTVE